MTLVRLAALLLALAAPAAAQTNPPKVWEIPLGTPVTDLPGDQLVDPACGTNGGPQGLPLADFGEFAKCPPEPSGLREIWFHYDDALEYIARAQRNPVLVRRFSATSFGGQPVILSFLVDGEGTIRGYRMVTDSRAEESVRINAYAAAAFFRGVIGRDWDCEDLPRAEGETPIEGSFVKERCRASARGVSAVAEARYYYRPGQRLIDPATGKPMVNAFESSARIEAVADPATPRLAAAPRPPKPVPAGATARDKFLAGASNDCPGCDLAGADLRRRDLSRANLRGANLQAATLHRANLRGADLAGANLYAVNLNRADLTTADFTGADIRGAMLYEANASRADFTRANLENALLGKARLAGARLVEARLDLADMGEATLNDAVLTKASLANAFFGDATMLRANLAGASGEMPVLVGANLRAANLSGATLTGADFTGADLSETNLAGADLSAAKLTLAKLLNADRTGTVFTGATMPDNTVGR
ncbi:MAG: pentapeptide repeat-containing protein [Bauldia sp.]